MKKVIVKAIVKASKADTKTAHIPFYKSAPITSAPITSAPIKSAPITSAPITSAPITSNEVYNFVLRYVVEKYPAVKPYADTFVYTSKEFYEYLTKQEKNGIISNFTADFYIYRFLWCFFTDLGEQVYTYEIGSSYKDYWRFNVIHNIANNYFDRFFGFYD